MARIFYRTAGEFIGEIYGVHPDGNIDVPEDIAFIDVAETPDQIVWPTLPDGDPGSERTSRVDPSTKALELDSDNLPPTKDEIYDQVLQNQKVFKAYVLAINDGSIVPGSNMTGAQLKAAVKAIM